MWSWFWRFARRSNHRDMLAAGHAMQALLASSRALYDELLQTTLDNVEWEAGGLMFVMRTDAGMERFAETDRLLREEFGLPATRYDGSALVDLEPALKPCCAGGWHYAGDGHLRPDKLMSAWRRVLGSQRVEIREHCELRELVVEQGLVKNAVTNKGNLPADQIVIATGAWTPLLGRWLGCSLPIQPGKGYSLTMPRPATCPRLPLLFEEHRVAVTPFASGYRIGSTMEFSGYDRSLPPERLRLLRDGAAMYLREPFTEPVEEAWYGWRPMTPDGLPYIGPVPRIENLFVAAGHGMLGVSMSPATGRLVAELMTGQTPHIDPRPYTLHRR
jgi:D-amino-acid dehydrogenase